LALVDGVPDERIVRHEPAACGGCGAGLDDAPEVGVVRRQVFDLPPMRIDVTEHQLVTRRCGCGVSTCGPAPAGVSAPVQYGPRVTAIVLYLVHDAWAPYDTFTGIAAQQLCAAHALRELQAVAETAPADDDWCWAVQVADALVAMQRLLTDALATGTAIDADALAEQVRLYRAGAQIGITETAARENTVTRKHHALARRLFDRCEDYLRFTTDHVIPPDNNGSERDIRMIKIRQKVSGCLRSLTGAQQFCAIRSYLSTANKHAKQFLEVLVTLGAYHGCLHNLTNH
jgi:hypothetical protein